MNATNRILVGCLTGLALWLAAGPAQGQGFGVGNYQVLSSTRVGRTEFEYVLRVTVSNNVASALGVSAQVYSVSTNTEVVQGAVNFGDVELGAHAVSTDTITIRQNRLVSFNPADLQWFVTVKSMPLSLTVDSPVSGFLTDGTNVVVTGSIGPAVDGVSIGRFAAALNGSNFSGTFPLEEGRNTISVLASNSFGGSGLINVFVTRDTTPPILNIETPTNGTLLAQRQVTVSGLVNDAVPGTVNPEQASVMVNGLAATILNRSFSISDVLLVPGTNTVTVVARDRAGNESQKSIQLVFIDPASQKHMVELAGDGQTAIVGTVLPQPLLVELVDGDGVVQTNQPVTFSVTRNDGLLFALPDSGRTLTVLTDDKGQARVLFQMGSRTGVGNNQVVVTSPGVNGQLQFEASGVGAPPAKISPLIPETQVGEIGKLLPQPWTAYATDSGGNPVAGAPITFTVTQGGGTLNGATTVNTNTDSDGRAYVTLTLGPDEGVNNNVVTAGSPGVTNSSAVFTASSLSPGAINATRVIGLVLDNANRPMSNILCTIANTTRATVTDDQGQFIIDHAPVGAIRLIVDAQNRGYPGEWHALTFNMVTVAGRDNSLDRPVYMVLVDSDSAVIAGGDQDVTLHLKDFPGATLTVFAHSLRDNLGQPITNRVTWTQVNAERIPMAPPQGSQPILTTAILPAGMRFDPPAKMCIPNSGLPPGQILELYGFDHDIGSFVSVGTATVSSDGSMICSDPGFGISKSGWHPYVPPPPPCTPVCGPPPTDTDCIHYETVPAATPCDCPTYKPIISKILTVDAKVEGKDKTDACTNQTVNFTSSATAENCSGLTYEWDFGDGSAKVQSASASHAYTKSGTFTATVTVKCGKNCDTKTGTVTVNAYYVEMQITKTADTKDDVVRVKAEHPVMRYTNNCQARVVGTPDNDVSVTLMNPDGKIRFPNAGDTTKALTLPKGGAFVPFDISGETASSAKDDAKIQAQAASGSVCGEVKVTVFTFDQAKITLTAKGGYAVTDSATRRIVQNTNPPSISYAASARLAPPGLDCTVDPIKNLQVSVGQNIDFVDSRVYDTPTVTWNGGVTNGTTVSVPTTITMTTTSGRINDTDAASDPLYDIGVIFPNIRQAPVGCAGAVDATGSDTPKSTAALTLSLPAKTSAGVTVGTVQYQLNRLTSNNSFITWCVIYDSVTKDMSAIWEGTWAINMNSAGAPGVPTAGATTAAATTTPIIGHPFANDVANDPTKSVTSTSGTTMITK